MVGWSQGCCLCIGFTFSSLLTEGLGSGNSHFIIGQTEYLSGLSSAEQALGEVVAVISAYGGPYIRMWMRMPFTEYQRGSSQVTVWDST